MRRDPESLNELMSMLRKLFDYSDGPRQAFVETTVNGDPVRIPYTTFMFAQVGSSGNREVQKALLTILAQIFLDIHASQKEKRPKLIWRERPYFQDSVENRVRMAFIRCRVAVPGVDLNQNSQSFPEGGLPLVTTA